ncbi:MFS transporter [Bryobacter aggregatus]|uniref:MFS transporter n=1 Tax=Bryobacter aggregatus TaxID=360054 RepID=UPI0004E19A82|nr:MFS transporter [Bryobacter aggregatus]
MPYRHRVLALLFALVVVMYLDRLAIGVAGPRMQDELQISPSQWGWVMGFFTLGYAGFELPAGILADRKGPRAVLSRIVLWWSAFTALTGTVTSLGPLLAVRFLFGAGEAGAFPSCASTIARWIPPQERARATSVFWIGATAGGILTPLLVVPLQQAYGWRVSFYLFAILGIVWAAVWLCWFRDLPRQMPGISSGELALIGDPSQQTHSAPWAFILRQPNFRRILLMYHFYCWGAYFYLSWLPTYLQRGRGFTEDEMKIGASVTAIAGFLGVFTGGFLSDGLRRRYSLWAARSLVGSASLAISGAMMLIATQSTGKIAAILFLSLGLFAMNIMLPVTWALLVDLAGPFSGSVSGAMNTFGQIGSFLMATSFGYIVSAVGNYNLALMPMAAMLFCGAFFFWRIEPDQSLMPSQ